MIIRTFVQVSSLTKDQVVCGTSHIYYTFPFPNSNFIPTSPLKPYSIDSRYLLDNFRKVNNSPCYLSRRRRGDRSVFAHPALDWSSLRRNRGVLNRKSNLLPWDDLSTFRNRGREPLGGLSLPLRIWSSINFTRLHRVGPGWAYIFFTPLILITEYSLLPHQKWRASHNPSVRPSRSWRSNSP